MKFNPYYFYQLTLVLLSPFQFTIISQINSTPSLYYGNIVCVSCFGAD